MIENSTGVSVSPSIVNGDLLDVIQQSEFNNQFHYHLRDLKVFGTPRNYHCSGKLTIRLPDITSFQVEFDRNDTVAEFRSQLSSQVDFDIYKYYLISSRGSMNDVLTLGDYQLKNKDNILLVAKGIKDSEHKKRQKYWLNQREKKLRSNTPRSEREFIDYRRIPMQTKPKMSAISRPF